VEKQAIQKPKNFFFFFPSFELVVDAVDPANDGPGDGTDGLPRSSCDECNVLSAGLGAGGGGWMKYLLS